MLKIEQATALLMIKEGEVSDQHLVKSFDLSSVSSEDKINALASVFRNSIEDTKVETESSNIYRTFRGAVDMVSHARVDGISIDITATKYISAINQSSDKVRLSIRFTSNADTRDGRKGGLVTRGSTGKSKEVTDIVVVLTGLSDAQVQILELMSELIESVKEYVLNSAYSAMDNESGKRAYLANLKYRLSKERLYQGRVRDNSEDLSKRQAKLFEVAEFYDIGEHSLDLSMYSTYSAFDTNHESELGNVFENEDGLKKIKTTDLGNGLVVYSRTCPSLVLPAKATYTQAMKDEVNKLSTDMQILQILVANCLAIGEISYLGLDDVQFNEQAVIDILTENLDIVKSQGKSLIQLESDLGVTQSEKVMIQEEISSLMSEVSDELFKEEFKGFQ